MFLFILVSEIPFFFVMFCIGESRAVIFLNLAKPIKEKKFHESYGFFFLDNFF